MSSSGKSLMALCLLLGWGGGLAVAASPPVLPEPTGSVMHDLAAFRQAVRSGGPPKDGIPSIDQPRFVAADAVDLDDAARIIGLYHRGEARAYPQRILVWHEIVNDEVAGEALSITYCPLTGTALGFKRGDTEFGVSGRLVNSNLVMYDCATQSEWPHMLGGAIAGELAGRGLEELRLFWTTWGGLAGTLPGSNLGLLAVLPGLLAGGACCAPLLVIWLGLPVAGAVAGVAPLLVPAALLLLLVGLWLGLRQLARAD